MLWLEEAGVFTEMRAGRRVGEAAFCAAGFAALGSTDSLRPRRAARCDVWSFGDNTSGQLGTGGGSGAKPVRVPLFLQPNEQVVAVSAGSGVSAAVTSQGRVLSWGLAEHGRLGHSRGSMRVLTGARPSGI